MHGRQAWPLSTIPNTLIHIYWNGLDFVSPHDGRAEAIHCRGRRGRLFTPGPMKKNETIWLVLQLNIHWISSKWNRTMPLS